MMFLFLLMQVVVPSELFVPVGTIIAVVDLKKRAWIYRRDGLGSFRLGDTGLGWTFVGKVKV